MNINFFGLFGLLTIFCFAVIGLLCLPLWLWLVAWLIKNMRLVILNLGELCREWLASVCAATVAIFNVIIYGQYEKPEKK